MLKEMWKSIKGYEGLYEISNYGNIHSIKSNFNLNKIKSSGYYRVCLFKNNNKKYFRIHRLVAEHFIENNENKKEVNHINGNKLDNSIQNLEWVTRAENIKHSIDNGLRKLNYRSEKIYVYSSDNKFIDEFNSKKEVSKWRNLSYNAVSRYISGERKDPNGFIYKYKKD